MSNAAFRRVLVYINFDMGYHVRFMPPRTYNFDMELHVNPMIARSMSNAAFQRVLVYINFDMGYHVRFMPLRTYNFVMELHVKVDMGSMSNGLTGESMSNGALGACGNDFASI